jgi:hypothetical protein
MKNWKRPRSTSENAHGDLRRRRSEDRDHHMVV